MLAYWDKTWTSQALILRKIERVPFSYESHWHKGVNFCRAGRCFCHCPRCWQSSDDDASLPERANDAELPGCWAAPMMLRMRRGEKADVSSNYWSCLNQFTNHPTLLHIHISPLTYNVNNTELLRKSRSVYVLCTNYTAFNTKQNIAYSSFINFIVLKSIYFTYLLI